MILLVNAQNLLDLFAHSFHIDGEITSLLRTCYGETVVMDFGFYLQFVTL